MLRTHLIKDQVTPHDIYTACGRYGAHLDGFVYGSDTGRTRFNAIAKDQQPLPGFTDVPDVDCKACCAAAGLPLPAWRA